MVKLTKEGLIAIHSLIEQKYPLKQNGIQYPQKIEDIVSRPDLTVYGYKPFTTIFKKAASLMEGIICGHAFYDGNKRTGLMATFAYLQSNNQYLVFPKDVVKFTVKIADTRGTDEESINELLTEIEYWLKKHCASNRISFSFKVIKFTILPLIGLLLLDKFGFKKTSSRKLTDWYCLEFHGDYLSQEAQNTTSLIINGINDNVNAIKTKRISQKS